MVLFTAIAAALFAASTTQAQAGSITRPQARAAIWHWWKGTYHPHIVWQHDHGSSATVLLRIRFGDGRDQCVHAIDWYTVRVERAGSGFRVRSLGQRITGSILC